MARHSRSFRDDFKLRHVCAVRSTDLDRILTIAATPVPSPGLGKAGLREWALNFQQCEMGIRPNPPARLLDPAPSRTGYGPRIEAAKIIPHDPTPEREAPPLARVSPAILESCALSSSLRRSARADCDSPPATY